MGAHIAAYASGDKRQPNLLFGVVRLLGGAVEDPAAFHGYTMANWPAMEEELLARVVQTNEAGRCAVLLPVLAALPQPLVLLEVGASAGLCLYPDRYAYRHGDDVVDGRPRTGHGRGTNVIVKRDGGWKMQHEHLSG